MKIGVVGCGNVGSASAYACVLKGVGTELILVDYNEGLASSQAEDILHATPFAKSVPVRAGRYEDLSGSGIIMISAGVNQKPGEDRLDLLKRNADIFYKIIPDIIKVAPNAILLIATNPVDVITHMVMKIAEEYGHNRNRIIGSGTILDTARFRALLAQHLGISAHSVHAHVIGEHGQSEVLHWSGSSVSNMHLSEFAAQEGSMITDQVKVEIDEAVRHAAARIIKGKGATWYGIGAGMARIAQAITENENAILTCSTFLPDVEGIKDVTLSLPHIVSSQGVVRTIYPILDTDERQKLIKSATVIRRALESLGM